MDSYSAPLPDPVHDTDALYYARKIAADTEAGQWHKSKPAAYLLWFFLGQFGADRWYLKQWKIAVIPLAITVFLTGAWFAAIGSGFEDGSGAPVVLLSLALFVYWVTDAITLSRSVEGYNRKVTREARARHGL